MLRVAVIGLTGVFLAVLVRNQKSDYSMYVILGVAVMIFAVICTQLESIILAVNTFSAYVNIEKKYIVILVKMTGITYVSEFASSICRDLGYQSIASQIEMFARLSLFVISIPVVSALIETISSL
ncbi:MAG: SpoIIIAC/SpoIIIAD family protein [Butyrivibrio sp.]